MEVYYTTAVRKDAAVEGGGAVPTLAQNIVIQISVTFISLFFS
jgi:hypothetical protein